MKYWSESPECLEATKNAKGIYESGVALISRLPPDVNYRAKNRFDYLIVDFNEEEMELYCCYLASNVVSVIKQTAKARRNGMFAGALKFLDNLINFSSSISSDKCKAYYQFFKDFKKYLECDSGYFSAVLSSKEKSRTDDRVKRFFTDFERLEMERALTPTKKEEILELVEKSERTVGKKKKLRKKSKSGDDNENSNDEHRVVTRKRKVDEDTPLVARVPVTLNKRSRRDSTSAMDEETTDPTRLEPEVLIFEDLGSDSSEPDESRNSRKTSKTPSKLPKTTGQSTSQKTPDPATKRSNQQCTKSNASLRTSSKTPSRSLTANAKRLEVDDVTAQEQAQQLKGNPTVILSRIPSVNKNAPRVPKVLFPDVSRKMNGNGVLEIGIISPDLGYLVNDPITSQQCLVSYAVLREIEEMDTNGDPYTLILPPQEPDTEIFDLEKIFESMDALAKYYNPNSTKNFNEAGCGGLEEFGEDVIIGEGEDEVWSIGYGEYHQLKSTVDIRRFLYDSAHQIAKQNTLMETLSKLIKPTNFYQEMFDKTILISAPKIVLNAVKLSPDLWRGINVIFSHNDGINLTTEPLKAVDPYVCNLQEAIGDKTVDCLVVVLGETELFDNYNVNLLGRGKKDPKSVNIKQYAYYLNISLRMIASKMRCPIFLAGYLDLEIPKDNTAAKVISDRRERKTKYELKKDDFSKYRQAALGIQKEIFEYRSVSIYCGSCNTTLSHQRENICSQCSPNAQVYHVNTTLMELDFKNGKDEKLFTLQGRPSNVYLRQVIGAIKIFVTAICFGLFRENVTLQNKLKMNQPELFTGYFKMMKERDEQVKPKFEKFVRDLSRKLKEIEETSPAFEKQRKEKRGGSSRRTSVPPTPGLPNSSPETETPVDNQNVVNNESSPSHNLVPPASGLPSNISSGSEMPADNQNVNNATSPSHTLDPSALGLPPSITSVTEMDVDNQNENDVERNTHSGSNVTTEVSSTLFIASPAIEKFAENEKHMETGVLANQSENLGIGTMEDGETAVTEEIAVSHDEPQLLEEVDSAVLKSSLHERGDSDVDSTTTETMMDNLAGNESGQTVEIGSYVQIEREDPADVAVPDSVSSTQNTDSTE